MNPRAKAAHGSSSRSELHGLHECARENGNAEAGRLANRWFTLLEIIISRGGAGLVLHHGPNSLCAAFEKPSDALNRALEIQRVLASRPDLRPRQVSPRRPGSPGTMPRGPGLIGPRPHSAPRVRIGLHLGEVLFQHGAQVEIISRHLLGAQRLMEAAGPGQIYASDAVVEAGRDWIEVPKEALAIPHYGEYYLNDAGAHEPVRSR